MATLREIVYNIKNVMQSGIQSDDALPSDRQYAFMIDYYRAKLVKERVEKGNSINTYVQDLGALELVEAGANECCEPYRCVLRTKRKLPDFVTARGKELATFVGTVHGRPFQQTWYFRSFWDAEARFTGWRPKWYYQNPYIYVLNPPDPAMELINIKGVFENPGKAEDFNQCECEGEECKNLLDFDYPLEESILDIIYKLMLETELNTILSIPQDRINESADTTNTRSPQTRAS